MSAVKQAEDATGNIIRLVELEGKEKNIDIKYFENEFSVSLSPYEIKTVKINGNTLIDVYITED